MREHKIIVAPAFQRALCKRIGAEARIQSLIDEGWEVEKLKCTGKDEDNAVVVAYLSRETE